MGCMIMRFLILFSSSYTCLDSMNFIVYPTYLQVLALGLRAGPCSYLLTLFCSCLPQLMRRLSAARYFVLRMYSLVERALLLLTFVISMSGIVFFLALCFSFCVFFCVPA